MENMIQFKGTKGKWSDMDENNHGIDIVLDNETVISMDRQSRYSGKYVMEREEMKANAQLISKAPEMLEALKEVLGKIDWSYESFGSAEGLIIKTKIKQLIKEATTI